MPAVYHRELLYAAKVTVRVPLQPNAPAGVQERLMIVVALNPEDALVQAQNSLATEKVTGRVELLNLVPFGDINMLAQLRGEHQKLQRGYRQQEYQRGLAQHQQAVRK